MRPLHLRWRDPDDDAPNEVTISSSPAVLGRSASTDVVLPHSFVSSHHARIEFQDDAWWIVDLESTNGVFVDGERVQRVRLADPGAFALGRLRFQVSTDAASGNTTVLGTALGDPADEFGRLRLLLDLQTRGDDALPLRETLQAVLRAAIEVSQAERACILLRGENGLEFAAGWHARDGSIAEGEFRVSRTVVDRALESGQALLRVEGLDDVDLASESIAEQMLRAVAALPLRGGDDQLRGVLYFDSTNPLHRLSGLDEAVLHRLAGEAEAIVTRLDLRSIAERQRRQQQELDFARHTQQQLLPHELPTMEGFAFDAVCVPSHEVGGDFFDLVHLDGDGVLAVVADVSGKGVAASLLAASTQAAIQIAMRTPGDAGRALARVNDFVVERSEDGRFVTAFVAVVRPDGGLVWTSAGHNPAFLWRAADGAIEELGLHGVVLGALESAFFDGRYEAVETTMASGDVLLVYSDGVSEAEDPDRAQYGEERLRETLRAHAADGAAAVRQAVIDDVARFVRGAPASDDLTLLVVERR